MHGLAVIGPTAAIIGGMFREADAHVIAWRRWNWLVGHHGRSPALLESWLRLQWSKL